MIKVILLIVYIYCGLYVSSLFSYNYELETHEDASGLFVMFQVIFWPIFAVILFVKSILTE